MLKEKMKNIKLPYPPAGVVLIIYNFLVEENNCMIYRIDESGEIIVDVNENGKIILKRKVKLWIVFEKITILLKIVL